MQNVELIRKGSKPQTQEDPEEVAKPVIQGREQSVEVPHEPDTCPKRTVIVFYWDDTTCPNSATKDSGIAPRGPPPLSGSALSAGNRAAINLLIAALQRSIKVVIVTNAGEGWVQYSRANRMPVFLRTLRSCEIVSPRDQWEPAGFTTQLDWKQKTFNEILCGRHSGGSWTNASA